MAEMDYNPDIIYFGGISQEKWNYLLSLFLPCVGFNFKVFFITPYENNKTLLIMPNNTVYRMKPSTTHHSAP